MTRYSWTAVAVGAILVVALSAYSAVLAPSLAPVVFAVAKDCLVGVAAIVAGIVAVQGLSTWKRQHTGTKEYDVALEVLRRTYALRDAIIDARSPWKLLGEYVGTDEGEQASYEARIMRQRLSSVVEAERSLRLAYQEALALWSEPKRQLDDLRALVNELVNAYANYYVGGSLGIRMTAESRAIIDPFKKILERPRVGPDEFWDRIENDMQAVDDYFRPKVKR